MNRILALASVIVVSAIGVLAGQVMMKGKVIDKANSKTHEASITFKDPSGKKIKVKSNKLNGDFQQLLDGGTKYSVTVQSGSLFRETYDITTRSSDSAYVEQRNNLEVISLEPGRELMKFNGFSGGSLNSAAKTNLKQVNKILRFNRGMTMDIVVSDAAKQSAVEPLVKKYKSVADRVNVIVDPSAGDDLIYKVNKNEDLFKK